MQIDLHTCLIYLGSRSSWMKKTTSLRSLRYSLVHMTTAEY